MKLGDQGRECLQSQSYHNPPKDQKFEELSKALEWILHHCCHLEQPVFRKKKRKKKRGWIRKANNPTTVKKIWEYIYIIKSLLKV